MWFQNRIPLSHIIMSAERMEKGLAAEAELPVGHQGEVATSEVPLCSQSMLLQQHTVHQRPTCFAINAEVHTGSVTVKTTKKMGRDPSADRDHQEATRCLHQNSKIPVPVGGSRRKYTRLMKEEDLTDSEEVQLEGQRRLSGQILPVISKEETSSATTSPSSEGEGQEKVATTESNILMNSMSTQSQEDQGPTIPLEPRLPNPRSRYTYLFIF